MTPVTPRDARDDRHGSTQWFRSFHGAPIDPKWLAIARRADVLPVVACALWWTLLDHASQQQERGSVAGFDAESVAAFFGVDEDAISRCLNAMREKKLIVDERIVNWEKRQRKRERPADNSADRTRNWRARNATERPAPSRDAPVTPGDALEESREEKRRGDTPDGGESPAGGFPPPVEMQFPKPAREAGAYQPSEAELDHGRAVTDAEHQRRRRFALGWSKDHPEELAKIEKAVDLELERSRASPDAKIEIRKSRIMAECYTRANAPEPALAAAS